MGVLHYHIYCAKISKLQRESLWRFDIKFSEEEIREEAGGVAL
jgi:hypothetical protein